MRPVVNELGKTKGDGDRGPVTTAEAIAQLDMGIWSDDGTVWLPKSIYATRSEAKMFAVEHLDAFYIDVRVRCRWMREVEEGPWDQNYEVCNPTDEDAFECWEVT